MEYTQEQFNNRINELSKDYGLTIGRINNLYSELRTYDLFTYDERGLECLEIACQSLMFGLEEISRTGKVALYIATKSYAINNALYEEYGDEAIDVLEDTYIKYRNIKKTKKLTYDYSPEEDPFDIIDAYELTKRM